MNSIKNKIALVTGGAMGIGKATSLKLSSLGAHVVVTDINEAKGAITVDEIKTAGDKAEFIKLDVSDQDQVSNTVDQIMRSHGRLDLAVNNAGIGGVFAPTHEVKLDDWNRMMGINLTGQLFCLQSEIKAMLPNGGGNIVNISSLAGLQGVGGGGPYCVSKHGLIALTKTAAVEYAKANIRVNAVCPGFTETAIIDPVPNKLLDFVTQHTVPMKRLGKPEEIASAIAFLLSDESSFMTGHCMHLDGGSRA